MPDTADQKDSQKPVPSVTKAPGAQLFSILGGRRSQEPEHLEEIPIEALSAVQDSAAEEVARIREQGGAILRQESLI